MMRSGDSGTMSCALSSLCPQQTSSTSGLGPARQYAKQTGFTAVTITRVETLERFSREHGRGKMFWLAMTAVKPAQ